LFLYLCLCCGNDQAMTSSTTTHDDAHAKDDADIRGSGSGPTCGGRAGGGMDDADGSVRATATSDGAGATTGDGAGVARAATGYGADVKRATTRTYGFSKRRQVCPTSPMAARMTPTSTTPTAIAKAQETHSLVHTTPIPAGD
jgi:hypothetical protein